MPIWATALDKAKRLALTRQGVIGVDYGYIYRNNTRIAERGVRFHLWNKLDPTAVPPGELLPELISRTPTDVIMARYQLHGAFHGSADPIEGGISIGNLTRGSTGTLGLIVAGVGDQFRYLLSNWHVLCAGDDAKAGEEICQPGPLDAGLNLARSVALLDRWANLGHGIDAALARVNQQSSSDPDLYGTKIVLESVVNPVLGQKVVKIGIGSGLTHGLVDGVEGSYLIDYSDYGESKRWMDAVRIVPDPAFKDPDVSLAGDSGSVWFDQDSKAAVALHFAGEDSTGPMAQYALAHPIATVLAALNTQLLARSST